MNRDHCVSLSAHRYIVAAMQGAYDHADLVANGAGALGELAKNCEFLTVACDTPRHFHLAFMPLQLFSPDSGSVPRDWAVRGREGAD